MNRTKSLAKYVLSVAVIVAVLFAASCSQGLLPEPEIEQIQGSVVNKDAQIEAPLTVKATQGKTKTVTVSWSTSNGATQYVVYSAASPHEEFQQIAETKGEVNSIDIQEPAGTSAYYRVCARNYKKELSGFSDTVFGSTMATPIISGITSSTDGTSATVSWWMENCSASTYQSLVNYVVYCYDESGNEVTHETASGKETSAVLSGLTAKTRYFYQVEAFVSADQSKPELSDKVDEETARRLIPDAPENLSATKGTDKETIAISWTLPPFCDVAVSGGVYERHPIYFTIERKLKGDDDTKYQKIVTYLGTQKKEPTSASVIQFSCAADGAATNKEGVVSVQPAAQNDADAERSDNYEHYISRSTVTYYDTTAERGLQYEYRVQSYVDDVKKTISAENAAAVAQGFLLSKPAFSASAKYDRATDNNNIITKITVSFKTVFEPYGQDYSYVLRRNYEPMVIDGALNGTSVSDHKITTAESISTLNTVTDVFDFGKNVSIGYYQYVLYICASGENDIAKAYDSITMSGKITVIDDASKLPTITRFDIEDGFADKFRLTWNYDNTCHYRLEWKSSLDDFTKVETLDIGDDDGLFSKDDGAATATYNHPAQSGERRLYTLVANGGVEVSKTYPLPKNGDEGVPEPKELETLGTAKPQTVDIGYRTISVSWPEVQRATGDFDIKAYYAGDTDKKDLAVGKYTITEEEGGYRCVITEPDGYDDPKRSGLPITMEITAKNDKTGDTTTKTHTVRTLGPAALNVQTPETPAEDSIAITWKKAAGAVGYLIYRLAYTDRACNVVERASCYYYEPGESSKPEVLADLEANPNDGGKERALVTSLGETYTLLDTYKEQTTEDSAYQTVQSKLSWGRPYGYIVLPVKKSDDFTFEFEGNTVTLVADGSAVDYTANGTRTLAEVRAATLGYGLNLVADKATSGTTQHIKWDEPNKLEGNQRAIYRREYKLDSSENKVFSYVKVQPSSNISASILIETEDLYKAFEYVVKYYKTGATPRSSIELPESFFKEIEGQKEKERITPDGKKTEQKNKGYLLSLDFKAVPHPYRDVQERYAYAEQISWTPWDYDVRAVGPESAMISLKNNNIGEDKKDVTEIKIDEETGVRNVVTKTIDDFTIVEQGTPTIFNIIPTDIANGKGTANGMLKVLRDYRHYYTLMLKNGTYSVSYEKDAYRQITLQEFARIANLVLAEGLYRVNGDTKNGAKWQTAYKDTMLTNYTRITTADAPGSGTVYAQSDFWVKDWTITYTDYEPAFQTKTGEIVKVAKAGGTFNPKTSGAGKLPNSYEGGPIIITLSGDADQKGTIQFNALKTGSGTMTVTFNGKTESFSTDNYFNTPLPFSGGGYKYNDEQWQ